MVTSPLQMTAQGIATATPDIELRKVFKLFGTQAAVQGVDLQVQRGELFSILGPSGCGKTTLLRLIAGFEEPSAGEIFIQGQPMTYVPAYRRPVNTVFQSYALFGHMTVWDNVAFGLKLKQLTKAEIARRVREALSLVQLESLSDRYPRQLSGGQQQRVALARALVNRPTVILLDEPLAALDLKLRKQMQVELSNLQNDLGITFIMVTHDQEEALSISSRIAVMDGGHIEQIGTPAEVYDRPATAFVAGFVGAINRFACRVMFQEGILLELESDRGLKLMATRPDDWVERAEVVACVRPERICLVDPHRVGEDPSRNYFRGTLNNVLYLGDRLQFVVNICSGESQPPTQLLVVQPNRPGTTIPACDREIWVSWLPEDCLPLAKS